MAHVPVDTVLRVWLLGQQQVFVRTCHTEMEASEPAALSSL